MRCECCATNLPDDEEPANVVLLGHMQASEECRRHYDYVLENLERSWTPSMSGG